jgi:uncharacterized protein YndB with AHSA1/START domain
LVRRCVIADSHSPEWAGPEGFEFTEHRRSFRKQGADSQGNYPSFDVPGCVPIVAEPGDL